MRIKANSGSTAFRHITASRGDSLEELSIRIADQFNAANGQTIEDIINSGDSHAINAAYNIFQQIGRLLDELDSYVPGVSASRKVVGNHDIKAARARAGVSRGTPEQMMQALNNKIAELSGGEVLSSTQVTARTDAKGAELAYAHALGEALNGEVEDFGVKVTDNGVSLQVTYMGNVRNYTFTTDELSQDMSDTTGDAAYMANTVFQDLDTMGSDAVEGAVDTGASDTSIADTFASAIEAEIGNEVESLAVVAKEDALVVTITYMGQVHEYNVPFADIHPDLSDMDGDVAYIVNTIRQDLDNIDNNV